MMRQVQLRPSAPANPVNSARVDTVCMRSSIRELNRSMESIEKMIQKTKRLISRSKEDSLNRQVKCQTEGSADEKTVIASIQCSVKKVENLATNGKGIRMGRKKESPTSQLTTQSSALKSHFRHLTGEIHFTSKENSKSKEGSKQNQRIQSPYRQQLTNKKILQGNPPQLSSSLHFSHSKSKEKTGRNPERPIISKKIASPASSMKKGGFLAKKQIHLRMPGILIEDQQAPKTAKRERSIKQCRFQTEQAELPTNSHTFRPTEATHHQKKRIALKAPESNKKSQLASQRSNKSTLQAVKMGIRQDLVDDLAQLETVSASDGERRAKFMLKIKRYGFVEKHLSEAEIWDVYEQLVSSGLPQIKWPIAIVEAVYGRMGGRN